MTLEQRILNLETHADAELKAEEGRARNEGGSRERFIADLVAVGARMPPETRAEIGNDPQAMESLSRFLEWLNAGGYRSGPIPIPQCRWSHRELLAVWYTGGLSHARTT